MAVRILKVYECDECGISTPHPVGWLEVARLGQSAEPLYPASPPQQYCCASCAAHSLGRAPYHPGEDTRSTGSGR